ncbi:NADPH-dependent diflavin oxidoreductase 1, partial [Podochytrium sp. JEL0797]
MTTPRPTVTVLYGSETGTAEECALAIGREAQRRCFGARVASLSEAASVSGVVVFVVATTGQGEMPRAMRRFWRFLMRRSQTRDALEGCDVAVFGLGDSGYAKFNYAAKKLAKRLVQLGANLLVPRGDGDDQHPLGLDGAFDPWCDALFAALETRFALPPNQHILPKNVLPAPSYTVQFLDLTKGDMVPVPTPKVPLMTATCKENTRITSASHFQDVRHVVFDISDSNPRYAPADVMTLYPRNLDKDVQELLDFLEWSEMADLPFDLIPNGDAPIPPHLPLPTTLRLALTHHLDPFGRPKRHFFHLLSFFTPDMQHAEKLQEFATPQGQEDLYAYAHKLRRTTFEVVQDFHSCKGKIPVSYLFDLVPALRPRMYSIASTQSTCPGAVELAVGIVKYKTRMQKPREGVCSKMIAGMQVGDKVHYKIDPGTLHLPPSPVTPILLIAAGTGIAPIRSLLLERIHLSAADNTLIVGFRNQSHDFLYGDEFEALQREGKVTLWPAFSRDQVDKVVYIQHVMVQQGARVWDLLERGGVIFVSGNAQRIPKSVDGALLEIFKTHGGLGKEEAEEYLMRLEKERRYQSE